MDPYEYLFSRLQLKIKVLQAFKNSWVKLFELYHDSESICSFRYHRTAKDLFLYLTDPKFSIEEWTPKTKSIVKLLQQFPRDLESKEHVDLLLTLNGLN